MMRRTVIAAGAALFALVGLAQTALAAESINSGAWSGSALNAGPAGVEVGFYNLTGTFRRNIGRTVQVTVSADPAGVDACAIAPVTLPAGGTPRGFNATLTIPCNGTYTLVARAITTDDNAILTADSATLDRVVTVAAPAPTVTGFDAVSDGRSVSLVWDDARGAAPDLSGYVVERKLGTDEFAELARLGADQQTYVDADLPDAGGEVTYRVFSTRPSPSGELTAASSDELVTTYDDAPATTTTGKGGSGGTGGGSGGGAGDGTGGGGTGGDGSGGAGSGRTSRRVSPPRVFSGSFLPPLLRPATQTIVTTPTTADTGFNESLPYERRAQDPLLPKDAMASVFSDGKPGKGMAIPVATALVLAIWAVHLRLIARAARPVDTTR
ncbi:MAG: hypothetical protein ACT4OV_09295 [Microthrixaceae bacterium]